MTQDDLSEYPSRSPQDRPMTHRWTLWARHGSHWSLVAMHRRERLAQFREAAAEAGDGLMPWDESGYEFLSPPKWDGSQTPDETLILPPGESPLHRGPS